MLYKVFDFASKEVSAVMVPRPDVVAISVEMPPEEALRAVVDSPYTRYPVYRGSLDDVIGILHVRDLFGALYDQGIDNVVIEKIVRPAYVVPETKDLASLLGEFRRQNQHLALTLDAYGPDVIVIRHPHIGAPQLVARVTGAHVVNATFKGSLPDTFKDGSEVVLTGRLSAEGFSVAPGGVMAKCPSKYEEAKTGAAGR